MERSDQSDKLFAEDTLPYPNTVDGERLADVDRRPSVHRGAEPDSPDDDMLAVEYREDEMRSAADPGEHTPGPEDVRNHST